MPSSNAEPATTWWVPRRQRGVEHLDDPRSMSASSVLAELADVARANRFFGGTQAVVHEVLACARPLQRAVSLLDVGTGVGDIPLAARAAATRARVELTVAGVELAEPAAQAAQRAMGAAVVADAFALPFPSHSVDLVTCSQVLHHFDMADGARLLRELDRVARVAVIVSDIRRSWLAAGGVWAAAVALRFHPHSRHDGVQSVLRGFTAAELTWMVQDALGLRPTVRAHAGFRLTATWMPTLAAA